MSEYIIEYKLSELNPNPINSTIYEDNPSALDDLKESIELHGLLEPLAITKDKVIMSGHRRFEAMKQLGIDACDCRVLEDVPNNIVMLIQLNKYRSKTTSEIAREIKFLDEEYSKIVKKGRPKKGEKVEKVDTLEKIAAATNQNKTKVRKQKAIMEYEPELLKQIDMGVMSLEKAYQKVRKNHIIPNRKGGDEKSYDHNQFRSSFNQLIDKWKPRFDVVYNLVYKRFPSQMENVVSVSTKTTSSDDRPMKIVDKKDIKYAEVKKYNPTLLSRVDAGLISLQEAHNIIRADMMNISEVKGKGTKSNKTTFAKEFEIVSKRYKPSLDDWIEQLKQQFPYTYKDKIKE